MTWHLTIEHIDVGQGDSTLIIARDYASDGTTVIQTRSMLVDGGRGICAPIIDARIKVNKIDKVDVVAVTHYDADHCNGIVELLKNKVSNRLANAYIFDQGEQGFIDLKQTGGTVSRPAQYSIAISRRDGDYEPYFNVATALEGSCGVKRARSEDNTLDALFNNPNRITSNVVSGSHSRGDLKNYSLLNGDWLVGKELLWCSLGKTKDKFSDYKSKPPSLTGVPIVTCIAANQYVLQEDGTIQGPLSKIADSDSAKNQKSLAFLVQFNNFSYYIGGDIESLQEGAIQDYLCPKTARTSPPYGVLAMKVSHHGSSASTTQAFVDNLSPRAAFISCGIDNVFNGVSHPVQRVLNTLESSPKLENYYMTEDRSLSDLVTRIGAIGPPPIKPNLAGVYTPKAVVAGVRTNPANDISNGDGVPTPSEEDTDGYKKINELSNEGNITLTVTEQQSNNPITGPLKDPNASAGRFTVSHYYVEGIDVKRKNKIHY